MQSPPKHQTLVTSNLKLLFQTHKALVNIQSKIWIFLKVKVTKTSKKFIKAS